MKVNKNKLLETFIFLTLASLPFYVIRCKSFSFCTSPVPFTFLEVLILLTFFVWIGQVILNKGFWSTIRSLNSYVPRTVKIVTFTLLLSALIGALVSADQRAGLGIFKAYFIEGFLLFIVLIDYLRLTKNYSLIIWSLAGSGLWIAVLAILNQIFQYNPGNFAEFADRGRASAVYTTSNAVGLLLGPLILLFFGYILSLKNAEKLLIQEKYLAIISLIILLGGLLSSGSRGAFLGVFAGFFFIFLVKFYLKFSKKMIIYANYGFILFLIIFSSIILLFFVNISKIAENPPKIRENFQNSLNSRLCLWEGGVKIIQKAPLVGSGLSGFKEAHDQVRTCSLEDSIYPHNIFLNFWTEVGIFGLISFLILCAYLFFNLLINNRRNYLKTGLAAAFIVILFHGLVDVPFFKNDLSAQVWSLFALALFLGKEID